MGGESLKLLERISFSKTTRNLEVRSEIRARFGDGNSGKKAQRAARMALGGFSHSVDGCKAANLL